MPDLSKKIAEFQSKPDPMQQQMQQLEMQKLQAEIAVLQSEAMENQAEAQLDMAKVQSEGAKAGTEQAKAANLSSDTDKKNLDFVEQESGTTHQRDVNKIKSQADAQTRTKVVEAMLNQEKPKGKE